MFKVQLIHKICPGIESSFTYLDSNQEYYNHKQHEFIGDLDKLDWFELILLFEVEIRPVLSQK